MNKKLIALSLLAASASVSTANAADGTINFTGNITDQACTVSTSSASQTVALGTISASSFGAAGATSAPTSFDIVLTSCPPALTSASVKFDGATNAANSNLLAITGGTGVATGVGIALYESNNSTLIPVASASAAKALSSTNDTTLTYIAKYMSTAASVTAGTANAVSDFTIAYN